MLSATGVTVRRGMRTVLDGVDLAVRPGEVLAVCGPNGSGKSTLLATLAGDLKPDAGTVEIDGIPIRLFSAAALARERAVLEQSPQLAAPFLVEELVGFGASCAPATVGDVTPLARDAMRSTDVLSLARARTDRLSGGEAARAHLSRVLAQIFAGRQDDGGKYLLLDEPTASLDLSHQFTAMRCIRRVAAEGGGVLAVLHDLNLAATFADRIVLLRAGAIFADGGPQDVFREDILSDLFGIAFRVVVESGQSLRITPVYDG
ncbi:MAG: heme ABC transporter ATP-binding protein [Pseudomonadota bacterium]